MENPMRSLATRLSLSLIVTLGAAALGGCASTEVRYLTAATWTLAPGGQRTFYMTYYEGTCSSGFFGLHRRCREGDSKVRRCNVAADNTVSCVDEQEANKALSRRP
jgi:hypothetical protein